MDKKIDPTDTLSMLGDEIAHIDMEIEREYSKKKASRLRDIREALVKAGDTIVELMEKEDE